MSTATGFPQGYGLDAAQARNYQVLVERVLPHLQVRAIAGQASWVVQVHDGTGLLGEDRVLRTPAAVLDLLVEQTRFARRSE